MGGAKTAEGTQKIEDILSALSALGLVKSRVEYRVNNNGYSYPMHKVVSIDNIVKETREIEEVPDGVSVVLPEPMDENFVF